MTSLNPQPGKVVLFGSGETSPSGQKVFNKLFSALKPPLKATILETPAGFELNSDWVAGQVAAFLDKHLQNYQPQVTVAPARRRNSTFSPDNPDILSPMLTANVLYMGAGSPSYAVRQLTGTLAWHTLVGRHRLNASVVFASASVVAVGKYALPVYEIYKVGEELHWKPGLDFFGPFGLSLVFVPHWNNTDGGQHLDTRRCYMGLSRYERLVELLPGPATIVGLEEDTALFLDLVDRHCQVLGRGGVVVQNGSDVRRFERGAMFDIAVLGDFDIPDPAEGLPVEVLNQLKDAAIAAQAAQQPPPEILQLVEKRAAARKQRDWQSADTIRDQLAARGWEVRDTPEGPVVVAI